MSENLLPVGMFLIFLTLKLMGIIDWSWWWITAPMWIPFAFALMVYLGARLLLRSARASRTNRKVRWAR